MDTKRYYRFRSNVTLNSGFFEKGHVYPLSQNVVDQLPPDSYVEIAASEVEETQRRQQEVIDRQDQERQRALQRPLVVEGEEAGRAAEQPIVGRPVVTYPGEQPVAADDAGKVQERSDSQAQSTAEGDVAGDDSQTEETAKKGKDFRKSIKQK